MMFRKTREPKSVRIPYPTTNQHLRATSQKTLLPPHVPLMIPKTREQKSVRISCPTTNSIFERPVKRLYLHLMSHWWFRRWESRNTWWFHVLQWLRIFEQPVKRRRYHPNTTGIYTCTHVILTHFLKLSAVHLCILNTSYAALYFYVLFYGVFNPRSYLFYRKPWSFPSQLRQTKLRLKNLYQGSIAMKTFVEIFTQCVRTNVYILQLFRNGGTVLFTYLGNISLLYKMA